MYKIGNLLSLGMGDATAKGMIAYVEEVVEKAGNDMDKLIMADIECDNTSSRKAFEAQKFEETDATKITVKCDDKTMPWKPATDNKCVLVLKDLS